MAKQQFFVRGTSCQSCEVVIERELKKQPDIEQVEVSHKKRTIQFTTNGNRTYTPEEINAFLEKHDYKVHKKDKGAQSAKAHISWSRIGGMLIVVASVYIILDQIGLLRFSPSSAAPASLLGVLAIGLVASLSSCTAVVGGLVTAVASRVAKEQTYKSKWEKFRPHAYFNLGRIAGFAVFGALIGFLGSAIQLSPGLNGLFVVLVAAAMIVLGINLLELFPAPVVRMPKWLAHKIHDLTESDDPKAPLTLGAMTFFLPCGFTQSMQLFALTLQDPIQSGLVMTVFAIGTAPVLLGIGGITSTATGSTLKNVTQFAGIMVLVLGFSNGLNGLTLLGINPGTVFAQSSADASELPAVKNGRQQIAMDVTPYGTYDPNRLTVQVGTPVDWTITGASSMGCANSLILPAFNVNTTLRTGKNLVTFTPTKTGRYTFSCSMGMVRGTLIVTE